MVLAATACLPGLLLEPSFPTWAAHCLQRLRVGAQGALRMEVLLSVVTSEGSMGAPPSLKRRRDLTQAVSLKLLALTALPSEFAGGLW